jgi:hypothetical protein
MSSFSSLSTANDPTNATKATGAPSSPSGTLGLDELSLTTKQSSGNQTVEQTVPSAEEPFLMVHTWSEALDATEAPRVWDLGVCWWYRGWRYRTGGTFPLTKYKREEAAKMKLEKVMREAIVKEHEGFRCRSMHDVVRWEREGDNFELTVTRKTRTRIVKQSAVVHEE